MEGVGPGRREGGGQSSWVAGPNETLSNLTKHRLHNFKKQGSDFVSARNIFCASTIILLIQIYGLKFP